MGYQEKSRKVEQIRRQLRRFAWVKGFVTFLIALPSIPFILAYWSFKDNCWPWERM